MDTANPPRSTLSGRLRLGLARLLLLAALLGPALAACDSVNPAFGPATAGVTADAHGDAPHGDDAPGTRWAGPDTPPLAEVAVMSQNLYLGANLFQLFEPRCQPTQGNPVPLLLCVDAVYDQVIASSFEARAGSIADEIARVRPALVGLQEVSTYRVQSAAGVPSLDFLSILLDALYDRGLRYSAVSVSVNTTVGLPALDPQQGQYFVEYQDADVVLALDDPDVEVGATAEVTFPEATLLPFSLGPVSGTFVRGYQTVEATVDGYAFTFVNTHLEIEEAAPFRDAQAAVLDAALDAIDGPVVLVGDLNAQPGSDPYALLTGPLADVFARPNLTAEPTCCQAADLLNPVSLLDKRIDYVLYRGFDRVQKAETVLDEPGDRVPTARGLLWPADHAGVAALLVHNLRRARPNA